MPVTIWYCREKGLQIGKKNYVPQSVHEMIAEKKQAIVYTQLMFTSCLVLKTNACLILHFTLLQPFSFKMLIFFL